jgi:F-type H+-transporting ATPase subunit b
MLTKFGIIIGSIFWVLLAVVLFIFSGKESADPHGINLWEIAQKAYNIFLLLDIILYFTGGNLKTFFKKREQTIKEEIGSAAKDKKEIETRIEEMKERLSNLDGEIDNILQKAREEAAAEKQAIIEKAKKESERTIELTKREIELEYAVATRELKARIATLAIEKSEEILKKTIKPDDAKKLIEKNIHHLEHVRK